MLSALLKANRLKFGSQLRISIQQKSGCDLHLGRGKFRPLSPGGQWLPYPKVFLRPPRRKIQSLCLALLFRICSN